MNRLSDPSRLLRLGLVMVFSLLLTLLPLVKAPAQLAPTLPNWEQITFEQLPSFTQPGGFTAPSEVIPLVGYDPSRQWTGQEALAEVLWLGDFQSSFALQRLTLDRIARLTGLELDMLSLASLELLGWQTLGDLVTAVPGLGQLDVGSLPVIRALLQGAGQAVPVRAALDTLVSNPRVASIPLNPTISWPAIPSPLSQTLVIPPFGIFAIGSGLGSPGYQVLPTCRLLNFPILLPYFKASPAKLILSLVLARAMFTAPSAAATNRGFRCPAVTAVPMWNWGSPMAAVSG